MREPQPAFASTFVAVALCLCLAAGTARAAEELAPPGARDSVAEALAVPPGPESVDGLSRGLEAGDPGECETPVRPGPRRSSWGRVRELARRSARGSRARCRRCGRTPDEAGGRLGRLEAGGEPSMRETVESLLCAQVLTLARLLKIEDEARGVFAHADTQLERAVRHVRESEPRILAMLRGDDRGASSGQGPAVEGTYSEPS